MGANALPRDTTDSAPFTPVLGYRQQSQENLDLVNHNKQIEECILLELDELEKDPDFDRRWIAIARTHIEQGFMAMNRAIMRPARVKADLATHG